MICTICTKQGHTASSCPVKPTSNENGLRVARGMRAVLAAPDPAPDTWETAWERLKREMKGRP
jgi:hypothetical protein